MNRRITIVTVNRNKKLFDIERYLEHACKLNCPIVFVDDNSDDPTSIKTLIKKYETLYRVDIKTHFSEDRLYIGGGIYKALSFVETEFCMRIDSDDLVLSMPPIDPSDLEFDVFVPRRFPSDLLSWIKNNRHIQGIIFRTNTIKDMYSIHDKFDEHQYYLPEDAFFFAYLLLKLQFRIKKLDYSINDVLHRVKTENSIMSEIRTKMSPRERFTKLYTMMFEMGLYRKEYKGLLGRILKIVDLKSTEISEDR